MAAASRATRPSATRPSNRLPPLIRLQHLVVTSSTRLRSRKRWPTSSCRRSCAVASVSKPTVADRLHLAGVVLPEGEYRDLWVVDGLIRTEPVAEAQTVATGVWLMPGLVDAHCHVGLESQGAVSDDRAEEHALAERAAGALLLRDAGSAADTRWMDQRVDLPKIIRAGRHIARPKRYLRNYGEEVEPDELVAEVERQAARGDGWVKLVGDWIDRDVGDPHATVAD